MLVVLPCFDLGLRVPMYISMYSKFALNYKYVNKYI